MAKGADYLKPEVVARLKGIDLRARLVVEGFLAGLHRSPYKGFSVEFCEHRQYMPGDELKRVDWKVYGRTDRFYIREYEEETNLRAYLIVDISGSMAYRSGTISKLDYAGCLAASLAYLLLHQKDSAGMILFSDRIQTYVPPRSTPRHLHVLLRELARLKPGGDTDIAKTLHQLAERIRRRGLVIVLSDFWDDHDAVLTALRHFRHRRHEVLAFHILDRNELDFDFHSPVQLCDMETGEKVTVDPRLIGAEYRRRFKETLGRLERGCRESLIDYHQVFTSTPFEQALFAYLCRRAKLH